MKIKSFAVFMIAFCVLMGVLNVVDIFIMHVWFSGRERSAWLDFFISVVYGFVSYVIANRVEKYIAVRRRTRG